MYNQNDNTLTIDKRSEGFQNQKPKERILKKSSKQDHDHAIYKQTEISSKMIATKFRLKIPTLICRKKNSENTKPNVEIEAERIEYLQKASRNEIRAQKYQEKKKNHSQTPQNMKSSSPKQTQTQNLNSYNNLSGKKQQRRNKKNSISDQKFETLNLGKIQIKQDAFLTQESPSNNQERFFEESISSDCLLTEERSPDKSQNSNNKLSPLRIGRLPMHNLNTTDMGDKNYFFNQRSSPQENNSFAFDSVSQSLCTDLEAWNQVNEHRLMSVGSKQMNDESKIYSVLTAILFSLQVMTLMKVSQGLKKEQFLLLITTANDPLYHQQIVTTVTQQFQLKNTFSRETVQLRKIVNVSKLCLCILEIDLVNLLIELCFKEIKLKNGLNNNGIPSYKNQVDILVQATNILSILTSQQKSITFYLQNNFKAMVQIVDLLGITLKNFQNVPYINENLIKLILIITSRSIYEENTQKISNYILWSNLVIKLSNIVKSQNQISIQHNSLMVIKILKLFKTLLVNLKLSGVYQSFYQNLLQEVLGSTELFGILHISDLLIKDNSKSKSQSISTIEEIILDICIQTCSLDHSYFSALISQSQSYNKLLDQAYVGLDNSLSKILLQCLIQLDSDQSFERIEKLKQFQFISNGDNIDPRLITAFMMIQSKTSDTLVELIKSIDMKSFLTEQLSQYDEYALIYCEQINQRSPKAIFINILEEYRIGTDTDDQIINKIDIVDNFRRSEPFDYYELNPPMSTRSIRSIRSSTASRLSTNSAVSMISTPKICLKDFLPFNVTQELLNITSSISQSNQIINITQEKQKKFTSKNTNLHIQ
ncbi:UNKNOWN [Stylonychia lemnae]|uniref:Uncharacterized protein n=1 Tax=Stylonychia lemnae TaxID=5949 RepID=A0A078ASP3_STYLE|nr:UNKNOWN [Stylonychia lemnae]|eukprot:CDW85505.1 UNKNOWN [Stylonychia lemnae]